MDSDADFFIKQRAIASAVIEDKDYETKRNELLICALLNVILTDWKERVIKASAVGQTILILYKYYDDQTIKINEKEINVSYIMGLKPSVIDRINTIMERHGGAKASLHDGNYGYNYIELEWWESE